MQIENEDIWFIAGVLLTATGIAIGTFITYNWLVLGIELLGIVIAVFYGFRRFRSETALAKGDPTYTDD